MLATIIAPEAFIAKNLADLIAIKPEFERLSQLAKQGEVPWSRTQSLLANKGGFVIRFDVPERVGLVLVMEAKVAAHHALPANAASPTASLKSRDVDQHRSSRSRSNDPRPK